jgi:predicted DNA-binding antitoxin AbrB/MazE fold protein
MSIEFQAIYENGVLKPDKPLPLQEHQRVTVVVQGQPSVARTAYGIIGWQGDVETVRKVAMDPEFGTAESP